MAALLWMPACNKSNPRTNARNPPRRGDIHTRRNICSFWLRARDDQIHTQNEQKYDIGGRAKTHTTARHIYGLIVHTHIEQEEGQDQEYQPSSVSCRMQSPRWTPHKPHSPPHSQSSLPAPATVPTHNPFTFTTTSCRPAELWHARRWTLWKGVACIQGSVAASACKSLLPRFQRTS